MLGLCCTAWRTRRKKDGLFYFSYEPLGHWSRFAKPMGLRSWPPFICLTSMLPTMFFHAAGPDSASGGLIILVPRLFYDLSGFNIIDLCPSKPGRAGLVHFRLRPRNIQHSGPSVAPREALPVLPLLLLLILAILLSIFSSTFSSVSGDFSDTHHTCVPLDGPPADISDLPASPLASPSSTRVNEINQIAKWTQPKGSPTTLYPLTTGADGGRSLNKLQPNNTTADTATPSAQLGIQPDTCDPLCSIVENSGNSNLGNFGVNGDSMDGNTRNFNSVKIVGTFFSMLNRGWACLLVLDTCLRKVRGTILMFLLPLMRAPAGDGEPEVRKRCFTRHSRRSQEILQHSQ